MIQAIEVK